MHLKPLRRLLLPVDTLSAFERAAPLAGRLIGTMGLSADRFDLLHVIAGSFLQSHMETLDMMAGQIPARAEMQKLREEHLHNTVGPLLSRAGRILDRETKGKAAGRLIKDGDPVKIISSVCGEGRYSTVVMSRRNPLERSVSLSGSVVAGVLHRHAEATMYLAGDSPAAEGMSYFARCLIGVDGSPASRNAATEAALLLSRVPDEIEQVNLVHVLDQSCYYDEDGVPCSQASIPGQQALEEAGNMLIEAGIDQKKIRTVIHFGRPGTVLAEEIMECDATLVFIGRRDRSRMAQVYLGSVCSDILLNCRERSLALCS